MNWTVFWQTALMVSLVYFMAFVNFKLLGTPVETFLLLAILSGLVYNDLEGTR